MQEKKRIQDRFESEKREREQRRRLLEAQQSLSVGGGKELVGYTLEDLSKITRDRPQGLRRQIQVFEGGDPRRLYHKYVAQEPSPGRLKPGESGVVTRQVVGGVDSKLRDRKVTLRSEGGG